MKQAAVETAFYLSLWLLVPVGFLAMLLWMVKVSYPRTKRFLDKHGASVRAAGMVTLFWSIPGLLMFLLTCLPMFFFSHLQKQADYCVELIRVNALQPNDPILRERCRYLDIDELFELARQ